MRNPFRYGRELTAAELVDRAAEVAACVRVIQQRERLFLIGPRRYGKTSILKAACQALENDGAVVFRYNAEAYPTLEFLVTRLLAEATEKLAGGFDKAAVKVRQFFASLRPEVTFSVTGKTWSAKVGVASLTPGEQTRLLVESLRGVDRLAAESRAVVGIVLDEFQHVIELGGPSAEGQLRAAVQEHQWLGYIFAGSRTRMLSAMTSDPHRPFYRLGSRLFVGPIPRQDFAEFVRRGFTRAGFKLAPGALQSILDLAEEVPYNVQMLAHACWNDLALTRRSETLSAARVKQVLDRLVRQDDPFYAQVWNTLTSVQQKALLAVVRESGRGLLAAHTVSQSGMSQSTMQQALTALKDRALVRDEESPGERRLRLEDPFFAAWLAVMTS